MVIDIDVATIVKNFLLNYAEVHGLPSPVRNVNRVTQSIIFLPAEMSYRSVHCDFLAGLEEESKLRALKYDAFRKLWHQLTPHIQIMSPRTDLCDTCQHLRNDLQFKARKEEEAQDLLKRYKKHLAKVKLERNYYNNAIISKYDGKSRIRYSAKCLRSRPRRFLVELCQMNG